MGGQFHEKFGNFNYPMGKRLDVNAVAIAQCSVVFFLLFKLLNCPPPSFSCTVIELHPYYCIQPCICKYTVHIAPLSKGIYGDLPLVTDQLYSIHPKKGL